MDDCQEVNVDDGEKIVAPDDISDKRDTYQKKYCSLKRLCDQVQHVRPRAQPKMVSFVTLLFCCPGDNESFRTN